MRHRKGLRCGLKGEDSHALAKRWGNTHRRPYRDQDLYGARGLTCLYALRRACLRELAARRQAGNRPVERSVGDPHATFVRGTEFPC